SLQLGEQEAGPAGIARVSREQLAKRRRGRFRQAPWSAQPIRNGDFFGRTACAAADQGKACSHTTHNVLVLLLFFIRRVSPQSQSRDSGKPPRAWAWSSASSW